MKFVILIAFCCVSCGSNPVSQPFATQALQAETIAKPVKVEVEKEEVTKEVKKTLAGKVTFADLSEKELADFRVIPETGVKLFTPRMRAMSKLMVFGGRETRRGSGLKFRIRARLGLGKERPLSDLREGLRRKGSRFITEAAIW